MSENLKYSKIKWPSSRLLNSGCYEPACLPWMKTFSFVLLIMFVFPFTSPGQNEKAYLLTVDNKAKARVIALHNEYRREVGVPPVRWSDIIQKSAETWALHLAENEGLNMVHAGSAAKYGENLSGGPGVWSTDKDAYTALEYAVISFGSEKRYYRGKSIGADDGFYRYGHYTQMVWRDTRDIGCAVAKRKDIAGYIVVCRYSPGGNHEGEKPF